MLKSAMFTLGIIIAFVCFGLAVLTVFAASMSDNPGASAEQMSTVKPLLFGGCVGIALVVGALFV